ncbi:MAG: ribosomal protein [Rickettsiaceae bacterium]|jgi:small subunit ribosomal protein S5|nr:ribosomal protein [Rickettsiaceae bacterium]
MAGAVQQKSKNNEPQVESEFIEKLVSIRRVAKVVKGGRRFGFSALVIVGDGKGRVGFGTGSGIEVMDAKKKATEDAKKNLVRVQLREGRTFHHDVIGNFGAGKVSLRSANPGTGIIAGGPLRAVFECLGVNDVVAKSIGTANAHNMVKACFNAFAKLTSPRNIAEKRGKKVGDIVGRRESNIKGIEDDK